jgi:uncharacterized protein DUF5666
MKNIRFLVIVLTIATFVLSACGGAATSTPGVGSVKVQAMPVAFLGSVDSIAGDQWVISGTTVTVDPAVVRDGPFNVGDQVKVEGVVNADGSFTVSRVEVPAPQDVSTLPQFGDDNSNSVNANDDHGNDVNINDDHGNDANINEDNSNAANSNDTNINDDNGGNTNSIDDNSNSANSNSSNTNSDDSGGSKGNDNGGGSKGNDNGGGGKGNDNGGNSNDG